MNLSKFISTFLCLFFFISCNTKKTTNENIPANLSSTNDEGNNNLIGVWKVNILKGNPSEPDRVNAELSLNKDSTFQYHDLNNYGQKFTEGRWADKGLLITLWSFDKYKPNNPAKTDIEESADKIDFYRYSPNDTIKINFAGVLLQLKKDSLIYIGQNGLLNGVYFLKYRGLDVYHS